MQSFWEAMAQAFPGEFFSGKPKPLWVERMRPLTDNEIQRGLDRIIDEDREFPPTLGKFTKAAQGSYRDFNMLDPEAAYAAAVRHNWRPEGVYHAVTHGGDVHQWNQLSTERARKSFMAGYANALDHKRKGGRYIRKPPVAPSDAPKLERLTKRTPEETARGRDQIAALKALLRE